MSDAPIPETPSGCPAGKAAAMPQPATAWRRLGLPLLRHLTAIVLLALLWLGTFWVFSRDCDQPLAWHPDEPGKVRQVLSQGAERNFLHPQLLLEATTWWVKWLEVPHDPPSVGVAGRQVSAVFGASTVTFFAAAGYLACGLPGLLLGGIATALCAPLMSASHYMKEDSALAVGIAATVFASRWVWNTRRWWSRAPAWLALGAACALAASGKYVGAGAILILVLCVLFAPAWRWWSLLPRLLLATVGLAVVALAINHLVLNPDGVDWQRLRQGDWRSSLNGQFLRGLETETEHSITDHRGITADKPNAFVFRTTLSESRWHILALACLFPLLLALDRRRGWGWETILLLFTAAFTFLLSYTVILFPRYVLPTTLLLHFIAALAAARLVLLLQGRKWLQGVLLVLLLNVFLLLQMPRWVAYARQFGLAQDSRDQAKAWLVENLPENAVVCADAYAGLEYPGRALATLASHRPDVRLMSSDSASRYGPVESLAARDAWVVIVSTQFDRYFEPLNHPTDSHRREFERAQIFYKTLLAQTPVWKKVERYPQRAFTSPDICIYHLSP